MTKTKAMNWIQKNTMVMILVLVFLFFAWQTGGKILLPQNITNLIAQNAYVFILATGMLLCILTGGNIDLSVGSVSSKPSINLSACLPCTPVLMRVDKAFALTDMS